MRASARALVTAAVISGLGTLLLPVPASIAHSASAPARSSKSALPPLCARRKPSIRANAWPPARRQLAPPGATAMRLCRYGPLRSVALQRARLLTSQTLIHHLVRDLNALPPLPQPPLKCPADFGSRVDALLAYPAGARVIVGVGLSGCHLATNGNLVRLADGFGSPSRYGPDLVAELRHLTS